MHFMRIITSGPGHAFSNMAMDEAISEAVRQKLSPPTLRLYCWDRPSLSLGYFQKTSDIDIDYCEKKGYPVVRRMTGGRAILHDSELTYSFSSPANSPYFNNSLLENYKAISNALVSGLRHIGVDAESSFIRKKPQNPGDPACFRSVSYGEISVNGKKIIGSAQKRYSNGFIQQGSILFNINTAELAMVLKQDNIDPISEIGAVNNYTPGISHDTLGHVLKDAFENEFKVKLIADMPSKHEQKLAKELEQSRYSKREWNFRR